MILVKKLYLIFYIIFTVSGSCYVINIYKSLSVGPPTPIPSRQITQKSLPLQELWRQSIRSPSRGRGKSPLLVATDSVIIIANYDDNLLQYQLQALNPETGQLIWDVSLPKRVSLHSLITKDEYLYVGVDWEIQAYQLSDGQLLWQSPGKPTQRTGYELAWLDGNVVNYSTVLGEDYILMSSYDPATGALIQQQQIPKNTIPLLTTTKTEYKGECGKLLASDRYSRKVKWQTNLSGCSQRWPVLVDSNLLVSTYPDSGSIARLHMINTANGATEWYALVDDLISNFAILDRIVYAIRRNGDIVGFDLDTGQEIGIIKFDIDQVDLNRNAYWLAANDRQLFVYYWDSQELIAFDLNSG